VTDIVRMRSSARASIIVVHGGVVYLAGQVATDRSQPIREQTQETLAKIEALLAEAGTDKSRLLTAQIWLKDIARDFAGMNEVWDAWTTPGAAPTRATAQCEAGAPDILIEIVVTAAVTQ
jgi:enamine deaminase RidA (YjgF/YER057c/UK114 family)